MASDEQNPWALAQEHLQSVLDEHSYKNWFSQTRFDSYEDGQLVVNVPSPFFARWLNDHYMEAVSASLREVSSDFRDVRFKPSTDVATAEPPAPTTPTTIAPKPRRRVRRAANVTGAFNHRYTFDRFVVGAGNRFAHAAAKAVAESPARAYNPLFLHGGTGLGKTHLMQAIAHEVLERKPDANIAFISSENFTNGLIEAIANKSTSQFRAKYRKVDVLLIDDIHFIRKKEATQEEFFHTFNELFDMHKQIVLSSDCGPKDIQGMERRLVSRFEWGLVTDIQAPDMETRVAILQNKAKEENADVSPEIVNYIATSVTSNIRELEGALVTTLAYGRLTGNEVTLAIAEEVLRDLVGADRLKPITSEGVQRAVAEHFDVRISDLRGQSRERQVAFPRQLAMYLCKQLVPSMSLKAIGEAFGGKHHTTVLYACQSISSSRDQDDSVRDSLDLIERSIRA